MKIIIESTPVIVQLAEGGEARVWAGLTESQIPVQVIVKAIAVERSEDCAQFDRELKEVGDPRTCPKCGGRMFGETPTGFPCVNCIVGNVS